MIKYFNLEITKIYFLLKVKDSKLKDEKKLSLQISKVANYLAQKHNYDFNSICYKKGTIDNDFIYNRFTIRITFNL